MRARLVPLLARGGVPLNTAALSLLTVIRGIASFVVLPVLLHRLGSQATGLFLFATTLTGYFTAVELGMATSVTKYVAEFRATGEHGALNSILRGSLLLMVGIGSLIAAGLAIFAVTAAPSLFDEADVADEATATLLVAAVTALAYWPSRLGTAALQGLERYDISAAIQIASTLAWIALLFWITGFSDSVPLLTGVFGATLALEGVVATAFAWPHLGLRHRAGTWLGAALRPAVGLGGGLFIIGIADTLIYSLDRTILAAMVGASAITAYEIGLRPQSGVRLVSAMAGGALIPTMSRLYAQQRVDSARELILIASFFGVLLTTPIAILVIVLAKPFVAAWLGDAEVRYAVYIQIFVSYWVIHSNTGALSSAIMGTGRIRVFVWLTAIGAVASLALSIAMTATWGTVGVIWGTVIPAWIGFPIWLHFALKHVGLQRRRYVREVVFPAYAPIALWTGLVLIGYVLTDPAGFVALVLFSGLALGLLWVPMLPRVRARWQRAVAVRDADMGTAGA